MDASFTVVGFPSLVGDVDDDGDDEEAVIVGDTTVSIRWSLFLFRSDSASSNPQTQTHTHKIHFLGSLVVVGLSI